MTTPPFGLPHSRDEKTLQKGGSGPLVQRVAVERKGVCREAARAGPASREARRRGLVSFCAELRCSGHGALPLSLNSLEFELGGSPSTKGSRGSSLEAVLVRATRLCLDHAASVHK